MKNDTQDKVSGKVNQAIGKSKAAIGNIVGNDKLQAQGKAQDAKGSAQQAMGNVKGAVQKGKEFVEGKMDQLSDKAKKVSKDLKE